MPKATPPTTNLKFHGYRGLPDPPEACGVDDWGLTPDQQESLVEQFRKLLAARKLYDESKHDYYKLRRFLRARAYDLEKATAMWADHIRWCDEWEVDRILQDFYFDKRDALLKVYPQGYHKTDKKGRPVYIQLLGKIDMPALKKVTDEHSMLKFHIQEYERCCKVILPICSYKAGHHIDTTFGIMDVKGVGLGHLTGDVKRLLSIVSKMDQDNYPEMLGHICIINAPFIFRKLWDWVKGMIDPRTQSKIEILGTDYLKRLKELVPEENIPDWLGGRSQGTLLDDLGDWTDRELVKSLGLDVDDLRLGKRPLQSLSVPAAGPHLLAGPGSARSSSQRLAVGSARVSTERPMDRLSGDGGSNDLAGNMPFYSPHGSINGSRRHIVPENIADSMQRSQNGTPSSSMITAGPNGMHLGHGMIQPIPEGPMVNGRVPGASGSPAATGISAGGARGRTLAERIQALERSIPKASMGVGVNGGVGAALGVLADRVGAASTKSAPEGSLLHRVEVLEEALVVVLEAQEAAFRLKQEEQLLQQAQAREAEQQAQAALQLQREVEERAKAQACCCIVM